MVLQIWDSGLLIEPAPSPKPLANHVDCCCPNDDCPLCNFGVGKPATWKTDLGAGGWVDSVSCDYCDQVAGEYTLALTPTCIWVYSLDDPCVSCGGCTGTFLQVKLTMKSVAAGQWKWHLRTYISWASTTDFACVDECWESADSVFSENPDCYDLGGQGVGDKIQMDKLGSCPFPPACGSSLCTGNLPDPVYIWSP